MDSTIEAAAESALVVAIVLLRARPDSLAVGVVHAPTVSMMTTLERVTFCRYRMEQILRQRAACSRQVGVHNDTPSLTVPARARFNSGTPHVIRRLRAAHLPPERVRM